MAKKRTSELVKGQYYDWLLSQRSSVFQADGRRNKPPAGRYSLNTRNYEQALKNLKQLDVQVAVQRGRVDSAILNEMTGEELFFDEGVKEYFDYIGRPAVLKGVSQSTKKRYRAVFNKAVPYFKKMGLVTWNQITVEHLQSYIAWLDGECYAYRTEFFEATLLKQASKHWVEKKLLPPACRLVLPMDRPTGTDTYCYRDEEVAAMVQLCRSTPGLGWVANVIVGLAHTGMRISELATLAWTCIDMEARKIVLKDESRSRKPQGRRARTNKSRRDRWFPIHDTLFALLELLHKPGITGHVFKAAKGGTVHAGNLRRILVEQVIGPLEAAFPSPDDEVGFKDGRLHSFRHYFCSWCANRGVPDQTVMNWLGHRHSDMVRHYYNLHPEQAQQHMKKLGTIPGLDAT